MREKVDCGDWTVQVLIAGTSYCHDIVTSAPLYRGAALNVNAGGRKRGKHDAPK